jgi:hypothetical protein
MLKASVSKFKEQKCYLNIRQRKQEHDKDNYIQSNFIMCDHCRTNRVSSAHGVNASEILVGKSESIESLIEK